MGLENKEIQKIISFLLQPFSQWSYASFFRAILLISGVFFIVIPIMEYIQQGFKDFPYLEVLSMVRIFLLHNLTIVNFLVISLFLLTFVLILILFVKLKSASIISDKFRDPTLNKWAKPQDASWTTGKCIGYGGKMLTVANSGIPGILKGSYSWYDYQASFLVRIDPDIAERYQCIGIVVRSENNFNGVMLQFTKNKFRPHLIYNGIFILDQANESSLPTILNSGEWIKVRLNVRGDYVEANLNEYKITYKIPNKALLVGNDILSKGYAELSEMEESDKEFKDKMEEIKEINKMPDGTAKKQAIKTVVEPFQQNISNYVRVILDYPKGSIGFREYKREKVAFRDFKLIKI